MLLQWCNNTFINGLKNFSGMHCLPWTPMRHLKRHPHPKIEDVCWCPICIPSEKLLDSIGVGLLLVNVFAIFVLVSESLKQEVHKWPTSLINDHKYVTQFFVNRSLPCVHLLLLLGWRLGGSGRVILFIRIFIYSLFLCGNGKVVLAKCWGWKVGLMWCW